LTQRRKVREALAHKLASKGQPWDQLTQHDFRKAVVEMEEIVREIDESDDA
jgi:hypothetical protein